MIIERRSAPIITLSLANSKSPLSRRSLLLRAAEARAAVPGDGIDLVDEDDAGSVLLALLEQVAHAAGAHADEHLYEVGTGDRKEGNVGFTGDGAREQSLPCAWRAHHQNAFGNAAAEFLKFLRL